MNARPLPNGWLGLKRVILLGAAVITVTGCTGIVSGDSGNGTTTAQPGPGQAPVATAPEDCSSSPALGKPRIWRLTNDQLASALKRSFGFAPAALANLPDEARLDGFANQASQLRIAPLGAEVYFAIGEELAQHALTSPAQFGLTCDVASLAVGSCLDAFIAHTGRKLWRRALSASEIAAYAGLFSRTMAQGEGAAGGVKSVVQALFMSPSSLHRTELGTNQEPGTVTSLTDHELASALSFLLWDSVPDDELMALADAGKLRDKATLLAQAKRLFASREQASSAINHFFAQWLKVENLPSTVKGDAVLPNASPELGADLQQELRLFTDSVLFDPAGDRRFDSLFRSSYSFVNERTAPLYGITDVKGVDLVRRELDPAQRRGIFTMLPFLWGRSHSEDTNLVGRGAYIRSEVLCHRVKLPAAGVPNAGRFAEPGATGRQRLGIHASPACAGCHKLFDGIGFALESYDTVGRYRTMDQGQQIDASGSLPLPSEDNVEPGLVFTNFVELVDELAQKPDVYACFAQQFGSYSAGLDLPEMDACQKQRLAEDFARADHAVDQLVLSVVGSPSFAERRN